MDRTNSMGLWTYSNYYLAAAESLSKDDPITPPVYFLVSHSIELAIKAFLRGNGISLDKLKKK